MPFDGLAMLTQGLSKSPDGTGSVHNISIDDDSIHVEDG
jgi:hypothetical protein